MLKLERPWTEQPQNVVALNPSHWLADSIIFAAASPLYGISKIGQILPVNLTMQLASVSANKGLNSSISYIPGGSGVYARYVVPEFGQVGTTISCWVRNSGVATLENVLVSTGHSGTSQGSNSITKTSSNYWGATRANNANAATASSFLTSPTDGLWYHVVGSFIANSYTLVYVNGIAGSLAGGASRVAGTANSIYIGTKFYGGATFSSYAEAAEISAIAAPLVINRLLTEDEVLKLYNEQAENPWQLFAPRPLQLPVTSGSSAPVLSGVTLISIGTTSGTPRVTITFS